jgi:MFS transporter, putative metabolite:H+ symporter
VVSTTSPARRAATLAVVVAALGYFVDIYDLILFGMVRIPSTKEFVSCAGLTGDACKALITDRGVFLFNMQMGGMLVGGILWGIIGDKRGRLAVLFGSITLYSLANIANGMVDTLDQYAVCRLIAGIGLAGELGAGITLVSELMGADRRGLGTTLVAALGVSGGVVAGLIGGAFPSVPHPSWRVAYYIGGGLGLVLLVLRIGVVESGMFHSVLKKNVSRGNFLALFTNKKRFLRYLAVIAVGIPVWYVIGVPLYFANNVGEALGLHPAPNPATVLFYCYAGCSIGGLACGLLSQKLRSRRRALWWFLAGVVVSLVAYFALGGIDETLLDVLGGVCGIMTGYWAVFVATAAELFGTNLRATVTTTVPNFVRGAAVPLSFGFKALAPSMGFVGSAIAFGVLSLAIAFIGLASLPETFGIDLDFHEE